MVEVSLQDLGITHNQSHRWQLEAEVPEEVFEQHVVDRRFPVGV